METFRILVFRQIDGENTPISKAELTTALTMSVGDGVIALNSNEDQPIIVGDYTYNTIQIAADE